MKKKIIAIAAPIIILLMMFSCGNKTNNTEITTTAAQTTLQSIVTEIKETVSEYIGVIEETNPVTTTEKETTTEKAGTTRIETTKKRTTTTEKEIPVNVSGATYIVNINTDKFHYPSCHSVDQMKEKNKMVYRGSRDELVAQGYSPCKNCNP